MTTAEISRLAHMAAALRPSWRVDSLRSYLVDFAARNPHRAFVDVALALCAVACDDATKTPKRLEQAGPWWADPRQAQPSGPVVSQWRRCDRCASLVVRGEDCACRRPTVDVASNAAVARAALKAAAKHPSLTPRAKVTA